METTETAPEAPKPLVTAPAQEREHLRHWELTLQKQLNAMPAAERKRRVRELRLMRRFAGPFCYHPKTLSSRKA